MTPRVLIALATVSLAPFAKAASTDAVLDRDFTGTVRPFLTTYCVGCHGKEKTEAELDLNAFTTTASVVGGFAHWELVLDRLDAADMPPAKAKQHPSAAERESVAAWVRALRKHEAQKNAGDPGPVLARRLSNAEYDYTLRDLTGVDLRPTREFPVDPANQAGFDNSGESLAMSPALLNKYLQAARTVADHLVLKPDGFTFAPHPVVADTDRDKYAVLRIVDFYRRQPTDYADYFEAAWHFQIRAKLGQPRATLAEIAAARSVSARYLETIQGLLTSNENNVGPLARLRAMWRELPSAGTPSREQFVAMRDFVVGLRGKIVPEVKNLSAPQVQSGSQTFVLWKNREMAANRRRFDPARLQSPAEAEALEAKRLAAETAAAAKATTMKSTPRPPSPNSDRIQRGGKFLAPAITTTSSSATFQMAAGKDRGADPDLAVPGDPAERVKHEQAFALFASVFPDAFYITERARVYLDAAKEKDNSGRLLSAGLHSMTGYFRDDGPLYDLVLDDAGRRELDRLWREFDFLSLVPQRMHTSFLWFERTDSSYLRDDEFTPFRPEDKSANSLEKIAQLGELYFAKAQRLGAGETPLAAIRDHFQFVAANVRRVDADRLAAEPAHLTALDDFAARAYRRPLTAAERDGLRAFYRAARTDNGLDHEDAMRDCIARVLMSPHFAYRIDLVELAGGGKTPGPRALPLSDYALASRLSYFLWSSMPDAELLARAAAGDLHRPAVLAAQARRMMKDARIRNFAVEFGGNWLDFRRFEEHNAVDRERFPSFDNALREAMFEEPVRFLTDLVAKDRSVLECLYGDYAFVNAPLARHYGLAAPGATATDWVRVDGASTVGRGGLLPMAVFLTANSPGLRTSPVKRGYWVVRRVLGERIPPPPPDVPILPADEKNLGDLTLAQTLAQHRENVACASCHTRFDSFGLVFEGYGAIGERREKDFGGRPVETRADFPGGRSGEGLTGLRDYIRAHREADFIDNLCRKLLAYALGRSLLPSDDELIATMRTKLTADQHRFGALVDAIVTSPQFLTKRAPATLVTQTGNN